MLICGKADFIDNKLIPTLKKHHKVSSNFLREEGDEISFLKRTHRLIGNCENHVRELRTFFTWRS